MKRLKWAVIRGFIYGLAAGLVRIIIEFDLEPKSFSIAITNIGIAFIEGFFFASLIYYGFYQRFMKNKNGKKLNKGKY